MVKCQQWLVLLLFAAAFHENGVAWAASGQLRVLVVHSTRQDTQLPLQTDHDLPRILNTRLSQTVDYYAEYIDAPRIPTLQNERAFRDYLRAKYRNQRFDLVIAMQDVAWDFVRKYRSVLFPRTPIVFSSRNRNVARPVNSTGVVAEINLRGTLDFALTLQPNTKQVFVVSGAFEKMPAVIEPRLREAKTAKPAVWSPGELLKHATTKDFINFGYEPEFIGRLPVRVVCESLAAGDLLDILKFSEGSIIRQYQRAFAAYGIEIDFAEDALTEIARQAADEYTGARGLATVCERVLRDFKYEMPGRNIPTLHVDGALVKNPESTLRKIIG